jgi:hypothetical protein
LTWTAVADVQSAVQMMMGIGCTLTGLSHMLQPHAWQDYFAALHARGLSGVLTRTMTCELWPALIVVTLHQVWSGPGILLTLYGWMLLVKSAVYLLLPQFGLRSSAMAQRGPGTFFTGGILLVCIGLSSAGALIWR